MEKISEEIVTPSKTVKQAVDYVVNLLKNELSEGFQYHNLEYTLETSRVAQGLCKEYDLERDMTDNLMLAALFHATGYIKDPQNPKKESVVYLKDYLKKNNFDAERIDFIVRLIESTRNGFQPGNLEEEILHDAIISEVGRKRFFWRSELLRIEKRLIFDEEFDQHTWEKTKQDFLVRHDFLTVAGRNRYGGRRSKNIQKQRSNLLKGHKVAIRNNTGKDFGRGVDTLYRAVYRNHINLSSIADGKANMMISINTVILSVIITFSGAGLSFSNEYIIENLRFVVPILSLLISSLLSVVFAVLSARPDVTEKEVENMDNLNTKRISLLYFGNFVNVNLTAFLEYLQKLKMDQNELYDSMSIDLYYLGFVLKKKYRLVLISYNIFMFGLIICVLAFLVIFLYTQGSA